MKLLGDLNKVERTIPWRRVRSVGKDGQCGSDCAVQEGPKGIDGRDVRRKRTLAAFRQMHGEQDAEAFTDFGLRRVLVREAGAWAVIALNIDEGRPPGVAKTRASVGSMTRRQYPWFGLVL